mgnify:CR=1 FL=1
MGGVAMIARDLEDADSGCSASPTGDGATRQTRKIGEGMARLHWFWRGTLSVVAGAPVFGCLVLPFLDATIVSATGPVQMVIHAILLATLPQIVSVVVYAQLTKSFGYAA